MEQRDYIIIAGKVADGIASEEEIARYLAYYNAYQLKYPVWNRLSEAERKVLLVGAKAGIDAQLKVVPQPTPQRGVLSLFPRMAVAAAILLAVVFAVFYFSSKYQDGSIKNGSIYANNIAPGHNGATLTLANGQVIELSDAKNGVVIGEELTYTDGSAVSGGGNSLSNPLPPQGGSLPEGERRGENLSPSGRDVANATERVTNATERISKMLTATTAKGQTYQVTLPDGTKVWLNANSKLTFPSDFGKARQRIVELTGEGYFAVVHNAKQPFLVQSKTADGKGQIVEDIGTEFNINAYSDEASVKTTLVEGSARVMQLKEGPAPQLTTHNSQLLTPGKQSILTANSQMVIKQVNIEEAVAWKEGLFTYNKATLAEVMRQVARWYNVEVEYADPALKGKLFSGSVSRYDQVSGILDRIAYTGTVEFEIKGNKILVK